MAKTAKGLTICQRANGSWRAQIRRIGYPHESKDFLTRKAADVWGISRLSALGIAPRVTDLRVAERTTLHDCITQYIDDVTAKRPSAVSRDAETSRLLRFQRTEAFLCGHALANLTAQHFEEWRDRRSSQTVSRGFLPEYAASHVTDEPEDRHKKMGHFARMQQNGSLHPSHWAPSRTALSSAK